MILSPASRADFVFLSDFLPTTHVVGYLLSRTSCADLFRMEFGCPRLLCQRKVEMSGFVQGRNVRFQGLRQG